MKKRLKGSRPRSPKKGLSERKSNRHRGEAKAEKEAHGAFDSECSGYCGAPDTFCVGNMKGVGRIYQQTFIDAFAKVACAKLLTTRRRSPWPNGQVERMHDQGRHRHVFYERVTPTHLRDRRCLNFARRKTLKGLTPYEFVCKAWTSQPQIYQPAPANAGTKHLASCIRAATRRPRSRKPINRAPCHDSAVSQQSASRDCLLTDRHAPEYYLTGLSGRPIHCPLGAC